MDNIIWQRKSREILYSGKGRQNGSWIYSLKCGEEVIVTQSYRLFLVFSKDLQLITRIDFNSDGHGLAHGEDGNYTQYTGIVTSVVIVSQSSTWMEDWWTCSMIKDLESSVNPTSFALPEDWSTYSFFKWVWQSLITSFLSHGGITLPWWSDIWCWGILCVYDTNNCWLQLFLTCSGSHVSKWLP